MAHKQTPHSPAHSRHITAIQDKHSVMFAGNESISHAESRNSRSSQRNGAKDRKDCASLARAPTPQAASCSSCLRAKITVRPRSACRKKWRAEAQRRREAEHLPLGGVRRQCCLLARQGAPEKLPEQMLCPRGDDQPLRLRGSARQFLVTRLPKADDSPEPPCFSDGSLRWVTRTSRGDDGVGKFGFGRRAALCLRAKSARIPTRPRTVASLPVRPSAYASRARRMRDPSRRRGP